MQSNADKDNEPSLQINKTYRIYLRISRSMYKSNCYFKGNILSKIENPRISRTNKLTRKLYKAGLLDGQKSEISQCQKQCEALGSPA